MESPSATDLPSLIYHQRAQSNEFLLGASTKTSFWPNGVKQKLLCSCASSLLLAETGMADRTRKADRVRPADRAKRAIFSIWLCGAVMLTRIVRSEWAGTRNATASLKAGSPATSSTVDGLGIFSPSLIIPAIWKLKASAALRRASSKVLPAVMHPGKSGKLTPKSDLRSSCNIIHQLSRSNARLLFNASQRANWYIANRMWHSDPSRLHRMLELFVAPNI